MHVSIEFEVPCVWISAIDCYLFKQVLLNNYKIGYIGEKNVEFHFAKLL
jgi:hypothetical protein